MVGWILGTLALVLPLRQATPDDVTRALHADGRPRLIHLWASWCVPCVAELPHVLATMKDAQKRGVDVVLLSLDNADGEKAAEKLLRKAGGPAGESLRADSPKAIAAVRALDGEWDGSIPTTYLLGKDGKLVVAQRGGTDLVQLAAELDRMAPGRKRTNDRRQGK